MAYTRITPKTVRFRYDYQVNGSSGHVSDGYTGQDIKSGTAVPNWRARIAQGNEATSGYSRKTYKIGRFEQFAVSSSADSGPPFYVPVNSSVAGDYVPGLPAENFRDLSSIDARALGECYKKLSQQQTAFSGMQFLGELRETISMFKRPFRTFNTLVSRYADQMAQYHHLLYNPKSSVLTKRRILRTAADSWLEVAFGLAPLVNDVEDAAIALARWQYDKRRVVVTGKSSAEQNVSVYTTAYGQVGNCQLYHTTKTTSIGSVQYKAYLDWTAYADFGSAERLRELSGFRLDQFVPTLYELVPWSWLADYWSNLGQVIETGCQAQNMVRFVVRSQKLETVQETTCFGKPASTTFLKSFYTRPGTSVVHHVSFSRGSALNKLPAVPFTLEYPGKTKQWVNMLAVWAQKLKP